MDDPIAAANTFLGIVSSSPFRHRLKGSLRTVRPASRFAWQPPPVRDTDTPVAPRAACAKSWSATFNRY